MSYLNIDPTLCRGKFTRWEDYDDKWIVEEKFNGDRRVAQFKPERTYFTGRRDGVSEDKRDVSHCVGPLSNAVPEMAGLILDGELLVPGGNNSDVTKVVGGSGRHALEVLGRPNHPGLVYKVFDVLAIPGQDLTLYSLDYRLAKLSVFMGQLKMLGYHGAGKIKIQQSVPLLGGAAKSRYEYILANGGEGVILKRRKSKYGDQNDWVKVKPWDRMVVLCTGVKAGEGKYEGTLGALRYKILESGYEGTCAGMTDIMRNYVWGDPLLYTGQMFEIEYTTILASGALQNPQFVRWTSLP